MFVYSVLAVQDKNANLQFSIKMPQDGLLQLGLHVHEGSITSCKLHIMDAKYNFYTHVLINLLGAVFCAFDFKSWQKVQMIHTNNLHKYYVSVSNTLSYFTFCQ